MGWFDKQILHGISLNLFSLLPEVKMVIIVYVLILRILNLKYIWNIIDHMTILTIIIYLCYPYYIYMYIFRKDRISANVNKSKENIIKYNNCK